MRKMKTKRLAVNTVRLFLSVFVVIVSFFASPAWAAPQLITVNIVEQGNNVVASFRIRDLSRTAYSALATPITLTVKLYEDDIIWDDFLGSTAITLTQQTVMQTASGGYDSGVITFTFNNASNQATGWGNDYFLSF